MKKTYLLLLFATIAALTICGTTSCGNFSKSLTAALTDSDSVAADSAASGNQALPSTLADAPAPKGDITTWLVAGFTEDGGNRMFIVEGDESRFVQDNIGTTDTIYILRLVSYEQTKEEKEKLENGETSEDIEGNLVVDAYDPATKAFVGRYEGQYFSGAIYDSDEELIHCGESYSGTFTKADGTTEEFSYYGD